MSEPNTPIARLLVVDDEELLLDALCNSLRTHGYSTTSFTRGEDALQALREQPFDLLISDLMMPQLDGIALVKAALEIDPDLVGIIITAGGTIESAVEAMQSGAFDYIQKPVRLKVVLPVISRALGVRQLRLDKRELERQVVEHTTALEDANKELEAFASTVSHDLRAPLRAVKAFSGILAEEYGAQLPADAQTLVSHIVDGAGEMEVLINDLLRLCRLSRQPLSKAPVAVSRLVSDVLQELRRQEGERVIDVKVQDLADIPGDARLLKQVFINLLSNAFKFTRFREPATVEIGCLTDEREAVYFVRDNGAGFDMKQNERLFQPFQRLHHKDEFEGTGVGLTIVQRIINKHGGRVWAEAEPGVGATFFFALPTR